MTREQEEKEVFEFMVFCFEEGFKKAARFFAKDLEVVFDSEEDSTELGRVLLEQYKARCE
jgi:hypothetical protein